MSRAMVTDDITNLAISLIGKSYSQAFKAGFQDPQINEAQKISFKVNILLLLFYFILR